ncbi:hypothetical protein L9F63_007246, partial [Diploptera punctata]
NIVAPIAILLAALCMVATAQENVECHPTADNETVLLANPSNCSSFYACAGETPIILECPLDLLYCSEKLSCSYANDGNCSYSDCVQQTAHELRQAEGPDCPSDVADNVTVLLPNSANCSSFYACAGETPILLECPLDLLYCSEKESCSYANDVNCTYSDCVQQTVHELRQADDPECPEVADNVTILLANPNNCSNFYECAYQTPVLFDCPSGLLYCSEKLACSYGNDGNCSYSDCVQQTAHELRQAEGPDCPSDVADNVTVLLPNSANCSSFYACAGETPILLECPLDLLYCSEKESCSYANDVNCTYSDCVQQTVHELRQADDPECPEVADNVTILLANPNNCSNFYECAYQKPVLFDCPSGLLYCSEKLACSYGNDENCSYSDCVQQTAHELRQAEGPDCPSDVADNVTVLLPNSANCSSFYACAGETPILLECPLDLLYCSEKESCSYANDVNCTYSDCIQQTVHELRQADDPECPEVADNVTILLANPNNCSNFYECAYQKPVLFDCPSGLLYCSEKLACSYGNDENCSYSDCVQQTAHELRQAEGSDCPSDVTDNVTVLLPNSANCSSFYACAGETPILLECPLDLLYCSEKESCSYANDVNCTYSDCIQQTVHELRQADDPECPEVADNVTILLANPNNCSNFYECAYQKPVLFDCPSGLLYCSEKLACSYGNDENCSYSDCVQQTAHELRQAEGPDCPSDVADNVTVLLPNSANCSSFYACAGETPILLECPLDLLYCSEKESCSYANDVNCTYSDCVQQTAHELRQADDPECPEVADNVTILLANPNNCSNFYECAYQTPVLFDCPSGLLYCSEKLACSYGNDGNCSYSDCVQQTAHELRQAEGPDCPSDVADNVTVLLPNSANCSSFYACAGETPILLECPLDLLYCSEKESCSYANDVNCTYSDCVQQTVHELRQADDPECPEVADNVTILLANPNNCSNFYECAYQTPVLFDCPSGLLYCSEKLACSYGNDGNCSYSDCVQQTAHELRQAEGPDCPSDVADNVTVLLPNSANCSSFYACAGETPILLECPLDLLYCSEKESCSYANDVNCTYSDCVQQTVHELRQADDPECPEVADNVTILLANPNNCSNFYECAYQTPVLFDCPSGLLYCSEKLACSYGNDGNCSYSDCVQQTAHELRQAEGPDCPSDVADNVTVLLPNPSNCSTFYACAGETPILLVCPLDLLYCEEKVSCSYANDNNCTYSDCNI